LCAYVAYLVSLSLRGHVEYSAGICFTATTDCFFLIQEQLQVQQVLYDPGEASAFLVRPLLSDHSGFLKIFGKILCSSFDVHMSFVWCR